VPRRLLLLLDGLLLVVAAYFGLRLYEAWSTYAPAAATEPVPATTKEAPPPRPDATAAPPLTAYAIVAERNLFSPTRSEAPPEPPRPAPGSVAAAPPAPKPKLYGVVLLPEGRGRAYLEDAQRRRVFAYSVGDLVGDARLEQIKTDRVVLRRGSESFEVLLYDPTKPRQAAPPAGVQSPEAGGAGRPAVARPPVPSPVPGPPPGVRGPVRPRVAVPPPAPPPNVEPQEPEEE
jgi:type II secretion system (T2SS) protein C